VAAVAVVVAGVFAARYARLRREIDHARQQRGWMLERERESAA